MTAVTHKRARRLLVIAFVGAFHAGVGWMLLSARPLEIRTGTPGLELTFLTLELPESAARRPAPSPRSRPPVRQSAAARPSSLPRAPSQPDAGEEDNAIHPPIDWAEELIRTARESASVAPVPQPRVFGPPHAVPTPPAKPAEFGWSHSRTHRLERDSGSTAVHLGDHCIISFTPLPFPLCTAGTKEANGDLFKHMRDPPQSGDRQDSP